MDGPHPTMPVDVPTGKMKDVDPLGYSDDDSAAAPRDPHRATVEPAANGAAGSTTVNFSSVAPREGSVRSPSGSIKKQLSSLQPNHFAGAGDSETFSVASAGRSASMQTDNRRQANSDVITNVDDFDPRELARLYVQQQAALRSMRGEFDFLAVPDWVRLHPLVGSYVAESFGTFAFVLTLSLVSVRNETSIKYNPDTNMTSLPIGFMLMCMVFTFGYISGGHFNPAVTLAVLLARKIDLARAGGYFVCQTVAALCAGLVAMSIQGSRDIFVPSVELKYVSSGIFSELIFTFAVALVVLNVAYSRQSGNFFYGFAIGMTVAAGSASVGQISGGAFNPAAATGLQLALCLTGQCEALKSFWVYWMAPLVGAVVASVLFMQMRQPDNTQVLQDVHVWEDGNPATRVPPAAPLELPEEGQGNAS